MLSYSLKNLHRINAWIQHFKCFLDLGAARQSRYIEQKKKKGSYELHKEKHATKLGMGEIKKWRNEWL